MSFVVSLNGFPAVGKRAVGEALVRLLEPAVLLDNHATYADLGFRLWPVSTFKNAENLENWRALAADLRAAVYRSAARLPAETSLILTNCLYQYYEADEDIAYLLHDLAATRRASYLQVNLVCEPGEHRRRLAGRRAKNKLRSWPQLERIMLGNRLLSHDPDVIAIVEIDTTALSAAQTALEIKSQLEPNRA